LCRAQEAYSFKDNAVNPRVRGTLSGFHHALLECYGFDFGLGCKDLLPEQPVDLLIVFQAIAQTFADWTDIQILKAPAEHSDQRVVNKVKAFEYAECMNWPGARVGLLNF